MAGWFDETDWRQGGDTLGGRPAPEPGSYDEAVMNGSGGPFKPRPPGIGYDAPGGGAGPIYQLPQPGGTDPSMPTFQPGNGPPQVKPGAPGGGYISGPGPIIDPGAIGYDETGMPPTYQIPQSRGGMQPTMPTFQPGGGMPLGDIGQQRTGMIGGGGGQMPMGQFPVGTVGGGGTRVPVGQLPAWMGAGRGAMSGGGQIPGGQPMGGQPAGFAPPRAGLAQHAAMGGRTVRMRGPTGQVVDVPEHVAQHFMANGAVAVG